MTTKRLVLTPSVYIWVVERLYVWLVNQIRFMTVFSKFTDSPKSYPLAILDIGCGDSFFLHDISDSIFTKTAVDIYIPRRLPGITYYKGPFEQVKFNEKFDISIANHVIEHIAEPLTFAKKMYAITKSDGVVMLSTPNGNSLGFRWFKDKWYHYNHPSHKHLFTKHTITKLLTEAGFKDIEVRGEFPGFPMDVVRTLQSAGRAYLILLPVLLIGKLFFPETITAIARK